MFKLCELVPGRNVIFDFFMLKKKRKSAKLVFPLTR